MRLRALTPEEALALSAALRAHSRWQVARAWARERYGPAVARLEVRAVPVADDDLWRFEAIQDCVARDRFGAELPYDLRLPLFRTLIEHRPGHDLIEQILADFAAGAPVRASRVEVARSTSRVWPPGQRGGSTGCDCAHETRGRVAGTSNGEAPARRGHRARMDDTKERWSAGGHLTTHVVQEMASVTEQIQYRVYSDFDQEENEDSTHWEVAARATIPEGPWHWKQFGPSNHLLKDSEDRVIFAFDPESASNERLLPAAERAIAAAPTSTTKWPHSSCRRSRPCSRRSRA
jgi:hypothetical protein